MTSTSSATTSFEEALAGIRVHDVDTHVAEPSDLWTSRVAKKWGDLVPHVHDDPGLTDGKLPTRSWYTGDTMICEQQPFFVGGNYDEDTARAAYDPQARLAWMDRNGVFSQVLYPNVIAFYPSVFMAMDPKLSVECVRAYNDFQTEFASVDPDRLTPLTNLPWWRLDASVTEIERCHDLGHKGINFGWDFPRIGFPRLRDKHWEPIFKTAEERGLPINFHVGFNSQSLEHDMNEFGVEGILDTVSYTAKFFLNNANCITELIMGGGLCDRYPTLNFVSVESGCGFLPFLMEGLDWQYVAMNLHKEYPNRLLPSEYFRRQVYGTFWFERSVVPLIDQYPDNFMFQSDFPHSTSLTPTEDNDAVLGPHDTIVANLNSLPPELLQKVLHDNAARVYHLN
jgi:predicted TIM-barrel fold metal-dependent hydrolase